MIIIFKKTARSAVRSMAEVEKVLGVLSVFISEFGLMMF